MKVKTSKKPSRKPSKKSSPKRGYSGNPFLKYSRLPRIDRKYCACIMEVRHHQKKAKTKVVSPYGVCTQTVYHRRGKQRPKTIECGLNYDLDNYDIEYIREYAKEKGISLTKVNREGKRVYLTKNQLIKLLRESMVETKKRMSKKKSKSSRKSSNK